MEARLKVNGQPIDPAATYTVAVSDYIGYGGSGYAFPAMSSPIDFSRGTDVQVVADFIRKLGVVDYSDTEGRIQLKAAPAPVRKLNFYSTSSLLGSGLQPLSGQEPTSGQGSPSGQIPGRPPSDEESPARSVSSSTPDTTSISPPG